MREAVSQFHTLLPFFLVASSVVGPVGQKMSSTSARPSINLYGHPRYSKLNKADCISGVYTIPHNQRFHKTSGSLLREYGYGCSIRQKRSYVCESSSIQVSERSHAADHATTSRASLQSRKLTALALASEVSEINGTS